MLPEGWRVRPPTLDDVPEILAVVHASDIVAVGEPDYTAEDAMEILAGPNHDPARDSWVVLDPAGRIVGWGFVDNPSRGRRDNFDAYAHPEHGGPAQAHLLGLILERIAERAREFGYPEMTARGGVVASETGYLDLLRGHGFQFVKRYARMRGPLAGTQAAPTPPAGVVVRPVRHEDEAEMREFHRILDVGFRSTPDYMPTDYATYRARVDAAPDIAWDEWLIALVDGEPAGIVQSSGQGEADEGFVHYLSVAPDFRGRGIAQLLLRTVFAVYAAKGRTSAGLTVDQANPTPAYRLYLSVGLTPLYETEVYERTISPS